MQEVPLCIIVSYSVEAIVYIKSNLCLDMRVCVCICVCVWGGVSGGRRAND